MRAVGDNAGRVREVLLDYDRCTRLADELANARPGGLVLAVALRHVHTQAESPIEKVLFSAIVLGAWERDRRTPLVWDDDALDPPNGRLHFRCQYRPTSVHPSTRGMRADSLWFVPDRRADRDESGILGARGPMIIIEADGHEWHKARFTQDKQRDRAFQRDGFTVMRFSGTEIWADPLGCAEEALTQFRRSWGRRKAAV